jgi:hypothetical protein
MHARARAGLPQGRPGPVGVRKRLLRARPPRPAGAHTPPPAERGGGRGRGRGGGGRRRRRWRRGGGGRAGDRGAALLSRLFVYVSPTSDTCTPQKHPPHTHTHTHTRTHSHTHKHARAQLGHYGGLGGEVDALKRDKHVLMLELLRLRQSQQVGGAGGWCRIGGLDGLEARGRVVRCVPAPVSWLRALRPRGRPASAAG